MEPHIKSLSTVCSNQISGFCLHGDQVIEIEGSPDSSLAFYRDHVSPNKPLIVRGGIRHWKAFEDWQSDDYFRQKCGSKKVTVTLTPDGYADAIRYAEYPFPNNMIQSFAFEVLYTPPIRASQKNLPGPLKFPFPLS